MRRRRGRGKGEDRKQRVQRGLGEKQSWMVVKTDSRSGEHVPRFLCLKTPGNSGQSMANMRLGKLAGSN
jgi:hypothetical protein